MIFKMRRSTENQGNTRALLDYFSPRIKVKNIGLAPCSPPHVIPFAHETPMKPSQVPNRLPYPAPRRMLPLQKPELNQVPSCQDQQQKRIPSSEKSTPGDLSSSSLKRRKTFEDSNDSDVKVFRQGENSCKAQTPKPSDCSSLSAPLVPTLRKSSVYAQSPDSNDIYPYAKSVTLTPTRSTRASLSPAPFIRKPPSMGAKQAYLERTPNETLRLVDLKTPPKQKEHHLLKRSEENDKKGHSSKSLFSSEVPQTDIGSSPPFHSRSHHPGHAHSSSSVLPVKNQSRNNQEQENKKFGSSPPKHSSRPNSDSLSCRAVKQSKRGLSKRPFVALDDISELFAPDAVLCSAHKTSKPKTKGGEMNSSTSGNSFSSRTVTSPGAAPTGSMCSKTPNITRSGPPHAGEANISSLSDQQPSMPTVLSKKLNPENSITLSSQDTGAKNSPTTSSDKQLKDGSAKSIQTPSSPLPNSINSCTLNTATGKSPPSPCVRSPPEKKVSGGDILQVNEDSIDGELDLSFALELDQVESSQSSDDEPLLSLQEIMKSSTKIPETPEKGAFSEPGTPGQHRCKPKPPSLSNTKTGNYKNSLDQMLKEINNNKKCKETEMELLTRCKEDLLRIAEYEEDAENQEEGVSPEHQEFLQRYLLMSSAIREVPPGEVVFNIEKFGQLFNHDSLQLRQCMIVPEGVAQKTLLWTSPAQLRLHVNIGLFQEAYDSHWPCPAKVTQFLFKMMSVHNERMVSENILHSLCDIACNAAYQIVKNKSQKFEVWVPSLADVVLVLMNMGASFVTLFPLENLQPSFTEGDLLEDIFVETESTRCKEDQSTFPEHNCMNVLKYLSYCVGLCPQAYSDNELLLLLTVMARVGMDTQLILQPTIELYPLQYKIVNNIRDWEAMLPRLCLALSNLTDDHHNMCLLVQMLPDHSRGKQLRQHLSLSMISKLLDRGCTYRPTAKEIQLSELRRFLPRMQPSSLLRNLKKTQRDKEDIATLDQQSYYLCYSLLTLTNEASNFQLFPAHQKEQLLDLCTELDMYVKCDIRESEKCLYRSKVKDLVARISTKWHMLLRKIKPLNNKLYDFWKPPAVENLLNSTEELEVNCTDEGEEETSRDEENEVVMSPVEDEVEEEEDRNDDMLTKEENVEDLEREPEVHTPFELMDEDMEAEDSEQTEMKTENDAVTENLHYLQGAAGDSEF